MNCFFKSFLFTYGICSICWSIVLAIIFHDQLQLKEMGKYLYLFFLSGIISLVFALRILLK